jgi:sigma-B regulation protein RsbU (phosphoserine phosphatase)
MVQSERTNPRLFPTLREDITRGGFFADLKREAREIEEFYLTDEERDRLKKKGRFTRWFVLSLWVLKNSLLKLTSFRRILIVVGLVLIVADLSVRSGGEEVSVHYKVVGALCLLLVIILELKDKLLAHVELESGRAVQRAMSPEPMPSIPGWKVWLYTRSANEVGGDLVDFLRLSGDQFALALGDVAGKGLGAALFMVKIQSTLRALCPEIESLSDLAAKLNSILMRDGVPGKFASLVFARIASTTGDLRFVNAGHLPPLLVSPEGVTELPKGNVALGLSAQTVFETREVSLEAGQSFVVYSDGVTEAQNEALDFYGLERFRALCMECRSLAPQQFGEKILAAVSAFEGDARRRDDLSLVIVQRTP